MTNYGKENILSLSLCTNSVLANTPRILSAEDAAQVAVTVLLCMFIVCIVGRRNRHSHPRFWGKQDSSNKDGDAGRQTTGADLELAPGPEDSIDWNADTQPPLSPMDELEHAISDALYTDKLYEAIEKPERWPSCRHPQVC